MTRKILTSLVVLSLLVPGAVLMCDCADAASGQGDRPVLDSVPCCCQQMEFEGSPCDRTAPWNAPFLVPEKLISSFLVEAQSETSPVFRFHDHAAYFRKLGPPLDSSETPLYISHRVFRI